MKKRRGISLSAAISELSREAMTVFSCGVSAAVIVSAALITRLAPAIAVDPLGAVDYYAPMLEYIMMTLLIVICGTAAFDLMDKNQRR